MGAFQVWRKAFILACALNPWGAVTSSIISVIVAHFGRSGDMLRYAFSHIISIASFWVLISSRLRPPFSIG